MFHITASVPILGVYQSSGTFHKMASKNVNSDNMTQEDVHNVKKSLNLISPQLIKAVAKVYNLSENIDDYIFPIPRAVTADVPNNNGDNFTDGELRRFSPVHRCQVFATFRNSPVHIEHVSFDPKAARGFLPDVHYSLTNPEDKHVLVVAGIDATKDQPFAEGLISGDITDFSMGCICEAVRCSYCSHLAYSDDDLCEHQLYHKMARIGGKLVYGDCLGVEFQELSGVGEGADPTAKTQAILQYTAKLQKHADNHRKFAAIASMLSSQEQLEIAQYVKANLNKIPESMIKLMDKLY